MSIGVQVWSTTASNNSTADTNINWAEGMAPSQVNDSARAEMASVAKFRDDNNGTIATSGTTAAYTVTTNQVAAALTDGYTVTVKFHATNDSSATLAQDGLAAKNLQVIAGTNVSSGVLLANSIHRFKYDSGSTAWIAQGGNLIDASGIGTSQIADTAVTYQKLQTPTASKLLGNPSTSTSTGYREISIGTNLSFSGQTLNAGNNTPVVSLFTSTGTATWSSTTQNGNFPLYLSVRMVGGGGGGGAVTTNTGSSGTDTSFASWTAIHGGGGGIGNSGAGGAGGTGGVNGTGTLIRRITGAAAGPGGQGTNGAPGAASVFGGAGILTSNSAGQSNAAANTGSGGSGGNGGGGTIGAGGGAAEYVEFIITSPSTSYSYTVGGGGAGGAAGGTAGGNGAAGRIEVISYWQ